jgi:hypothetical protein
MRPVPRVGQVIEIMKKGWRHSIGWMMNIITLAKPSRSAYGLCKAIERSKTKGAIMDMNLFTLAVALLGLAGVGIWVYKKGT